MGGRHVAVDRLVVDRATPVHRLAPEAKLVGLLVFVVAVAVTPRRHVAVFALDAVVVAGVVALSQIPARVLLARLVPIVPILVVAVALPVIGTGDRVEVAWLTVSVDGSWAAFNVVAKATIGATAGVVLAATTPFAGIVTGLGRLRMPSVVVAIMAFMFRYLEVVAGQLSRMRDAMTARAHDPRWLWQARPIASSLGVLFVRSYERGERVHRAMLARGYTGAMPELSSRRAAAGDWVLALAPGAVAWLVLAVSTSSAVGWWPA